MAIDDRRTTIALAVTGSIAAYKAVEVARLLIKNGHRVIPLMTASATRFVGPVTLSGICGEPIATDMWDPNFPGEMHVAIADRADIVAIVPATADILARLAHGRADDLVTATALCAKGPVLVAPAMHPRMWSHAATQNNLRLLEQLGRVQLIGPVVGPVASGDVGMGRMEEPAAIAAAIEVAIATSRSSSSTGSKTNSTTNANTKRDLVGKRIVVTAGPTHEPIDPVRFLGNRSSGKMGFALAACAAARGARVVLIAGPVALATPPNVERRDVETAEQMRAALADVLGADLAGADALVMAAAVADFRPTSSSPLKIKKVPTGGGGGGGGGNGGVLNGIPLTQNPDLIAEIAARRAAAAATNSKKKPVLVAFALETGDDAAVLDYAKKKLAAKKVDLIVANAAHESLGRVENRVAIVDARGASSPFIAQTKGALAEMILERVSDLLSS